jgi:hypothetical protein
LRHFDSWRTSTLGGVTHDSHLNIRLKKVKGILPNFAKLDQMTEKSVIEVLCIAFAFALANPPPAMMACQAKPMSKNFA